MIQRKCFWLAIALAAGFCLSSACAGDLEPAAWWKFDSPKGKTALDSVAGTEDKLNGNFEYVNRGVSGKAIKFDGYTTSLVRKADDVPDLSAGFTIEAWVALQVLPWNWTAIAEQQGPAVAEQQTSKLPSAGEKFDPGLVGIRYKGADLTRPNNEVDKLFNPTSDFTGGENNWSARWFGYIEAPATGPVTFTAKVDNGLRFKINKRMVLDAWDGNKNAKGTIMMEEGKKYPVELTYFQDGGNSIMKLYWQWPGSGAKGLPDNCLWHDSRHPAIVQNQLKPKIEPVKRNPHLFFGIDAYGHLGMKLNLAGKAYQCTSKERLDLLKWSHVAGTYDPAVGIAVYINGRKVGETVTQGRLSNRGLSDLWLGKGHKKNYPTGTERTPSKRLLSNMIIDGLLDEIKLYSRSMSAGELARDFAAVKPAKPQPLKWRVMPSGPKNMPKRFGAYYTRLRYADEWERLWRVGPDPDILVTFDNSPVRVAFWRGINYGASWITENGKWMGDQSLEDGGTGWGCSEHMSDKQCRYSHVRLIEKNDARIVVHWRYAVCDIRYTINHEDPVTGWGDWTDEYFYIYPDAVAVRKQILHTSKPGGFQWQETILFDPPGTRPEDNLELDAFSLANLDGQTHTYSWKNGTPGEFTEPKNPTIQMTNLKSRYRPFLIFQPGCRIERFGGRNSLSHFRWWNHWPVAQLPNDGRVATGPDRPAHTSLSSGRPIRERMPDGSTVVALLYGMTEEPIKDVVPLARSWSYPAKMKVLKGNYTVNGYDKHQRAYVLNCKEKGKPSTLQFELAGSEKSPVVNPAFVVENWGTADAKLQINGKRIRPGSKFRLGHRDTLAGTDLIVWLEKESTKPISISLSPTSN